MSVNTKHRLTASVAREVAVAGSVDPRTLRRYLDGETVSPMCAARIERALRERGLDGVVQDTGTHESTPPSAA